MKSGLERVAEELMGRRKWKHYQDVLTRQQLNLLDPSTNATVADVDVDVDLLQSAAAAVVASSVASNAVPSLVAEAAAAVVVGGNLFDQKGATAIVRNGHYQQDGELALVESKLATSNNQQVAVAAEKHPAAASAAVVEHSDLPAPTAAGKHQNHFNENDTTRSTMATAAATANPTSSPPSPPHPAAVAAAAATTPVTTLLNNHHHHHHHHQQHNHSQHQRGGGGPHGSSPGPGGVDQQQQQTLSDELDRQRHHQQPEEEGGRIGNSVSSPALSSSSSSTTATTTTTTATTALLSPAGNTEQDDRVRLQEMQMLGGKLTAIKQEPTENQNNSSATPEQQQQQQQSKLIKQENCNNLLNSKIIINNNNSATNNNNNNNNNISSGGGDTDGTGAAGSTPDGENSSSKQRHQHQHQHQHHHHHHQNHPSQPPTPVDWKPQEKCYFCVDGKLLTVNEAGELVPESGNPALPGGGGVAATQRVVPKTEVLNDSDCESSDSSESDLRAAIAAGRAGGLPGSKSLAALLRSTGGGGGASSGVSPTMASLQTMASQFAAMASLPPGLAQLYSPLWYSQLQQQMSPSGAGGSTTVDPTAAGVSPTGKAGAAAEGGAAPVVVGPGGEQPLDLSAKPGSSGLSAALNAGQLMMSMMDPKNIYKAKPRLSPIGGRRTYTEDELQSALQDILNGKLGTRRAAVQYGIPRSTLRNKVYKLAMEYKRDMLHNVPLDDDDDDDEKDSLEDDGGGSSSNQVKYNQQALAEAYLRLYGGGSSSSTPKPEPTSAPSTPPQQHPTPEPPMLKPIHPQTSQPQQQTATPQSSPLAAAANSLIDPSILLQLQSLLLTGTLPRLSNQAAQSGNPDEAAAAQAALATLPELLKKLIQQQELIAEQIKKAAGGPEPQRPSASTPTLNNGQPIDPRLFPYLQQSKSRATPGTPETTTSSMDLNDAGSDDSQVILKVPSYKPVPNQAPLPTAAALLAASKNGDHHNLSTPSPPTNSVPSVRDLSSLVVGGPGPSLNSNSTPRPVHTASPQQPSSAQPSNHLSVISPPMGGIRRRSSSQSPPSLLGSKSMLSINDVIARSISKNFQQHHQSDLIKQQMESMEQQYKRPTISVIKNLGGTDISRFGTNPNITQMTAQQLANTGTGGKGTRPKRGKYRNYDRDSLVEAVKAVQRGEMSVHRAGSYYGVPHSTLEYKVKERHLMRPRKREPKPQPGLDGLKSDLGGVGGSSGGMRSMDKSKSMGMGAGGKSQQMKNQYAGASPNGGLKMPMFDPTMASQLPYPPPFLWPPTGFPGMPMDFGRQAGASAGAGGSSGASAIMQRFQPDQQGSKLPSAVSNNSASGGGGPKTTRELAESIYDGTSTNGSFLDDIIRRSLDKKPSDMHHGALFDQLMKTNRSSQPQSSSGTEDPAATAALLAQVGAKRSATSPLNFLPEIIKRERASPGASSTSSSSSRLGSVSFNDHHHLQQQQRHLNTSSESLFESQLAKNNLAVESLIKLREDLTSMSAAHHHNRTSMEDQHNGGKDDLSQSVSEQLQQQQHQHQQQQQHHHHQLLSQRLVTKLPTDDGSS